MSIPNTVKAKVLNPQTLGAWEKLASLLPDKRFTTLYHPLPALILGSLPPWAQDMKAGQGLGSTPPSVAVRVAEAHPVEGGISAILRVTPFSHMGVTPGPADGSLWIRVLIPAFHVDPLVSMWVE